MLDNEISIMKIDPSERDTITYLQPSSIVYHARSVTIKSPSILRLTFVGLSLVIILIRPIVLSKLA